MAESCRSIRVPDERRGLNLRADAWKRYSAEGEGEGRGWHGRRRHGDRSGVLEASRLRWIKRNDCVIQRCYGLRYNRQEILIELAATSAIDLGLELEPGADWNL